MILMCFQHILSSPDEIMTMNGQKLPLKCSVDYISFSAHTDYQQTSEFIRALKPAQIVSIPSQICQNFIINMSLRHPCHINMVSFFVFLRRLTLGVGYFVVPLSNCTAISQQPTALYFWTF